MVSKIQNKVPTKVILGLNYSPHAVYDYY